MSSFKDYQLVLQFRGESLADYDAMIALENELIAELGDSANVDGHDAGSGEVNIFIITADPVRTFPQSKVVLERKRCLRAVTAAYHPVGGASLFLFGARRRGVPISALSLP